MATRGTILITREKVQYANAKESKTLLNRIVNSKDVAFVYNHYDSYNLGKIFKNLAKNLIFQAYIQTGTKIIQKALAAHLVVYYNYIYPHLPKSSHGVYVQDYYNIDSEYMIWIDLHNNVIRFYETKWTFDPEWDIEKLKLIETIPIKNMPECVDIYKNINDILMSEE